MGVNTLLICLEQFVVFACRYQMTKMKNALVITSTHLFFGKKTTKKQKQNKLKKLTDNAVKSHDVKKKK